MSKAIEEKYRSLTDVEHVLHRPGMYIGSTVSEKVDKYILTENKFKKTTIKYNPGFQKLFDEIISNSVDESKRQGSKLDTIKVEVDVENGEITVWDNGGIPVEFHNKENMYIPELIFSKMRAGSNFDDTDNREGVGTNGLGSTAVNIFSTMFKVVTCDSKHKFKQTYKNNMSKKSEPTITDTNTHYTEISYIPDFTRFGMTTIDEDNFKAIESRVYEVAGTNPNLTIYFNKKKIKINSFKDYCKMFLDDDSDFIFEETKDKKWSVGVAPSNNDYQCIGFVNGGTCPDGTHIDFVLSQIIPTIREKIKKKYKADLVPGQLKQHMFVFVNATVANPKYHSQTKEKLISDNASFVNKILLSDKFVNNIYKSEIVNLITDWIDKKKAADESKAEREANKALAKVKVEKLVDCKFAGTKDKDKTSLSVTEGDSAAAGFRKFRDPQTQALLPIRGKILNVREVQKSKLLANAEIKGIMAAIGLQFGVSPFVYDKEGNLIEDNLRINELRIYSDSDPDGDAICGLILNFIESYWPELFKEHRIARCLTPLLIVKHGKNTFKFYFQKDYDEWLKNHKDDKFEVNYFKGLGALSDSEYKEIVQTPKLQYYELDDVSKEKLNIWFCNDSEGRKLEMLK